MSNKSEGLVHKSKTAKGNEVVREGDGVILSALMGRKPTTSKKGQRGKTNKQINRKNQPTSTTEEADEIADCKGVFSKRQGSWKELSLLI